jgi:hypothetical protein
MTGADDWPEDPEYQRMPASARRRFCRAWLRVVGWRQVQAVIGCIGSVIAAAILFAHDDPGPGAGFLALGAWCAGAYGIGWWCQRCLEQPDPEDHP